jgi:hypothetical protein
MIRSKPYDEGFGSYPGSPADANASVNDALGVIEPELRIQFTKLG